MPEETEALASSARATRMQAPPEWAEQDAHDAPLVPCAPPQFADEAPGPSGVVPAAPPQFGEEFAITADEEEAIRYYEATNAKKRRTSELHANSQYHPSDRRFTPLVQPKNSAGEDACDRMHSKSFMQGQLTRRDCGRLAEQLEAQRQVRADYSGRLIAHPHVSKQGKLKSVFEEVEAAMTDEKDTNGNGVHRLGSTGVKRSAAAAAAAVMPTTQDVLSSGIDDQFLRDVLQGRSSKHFGGCEWYHLLGLKQNLPWDFERLYDSPEGQDKLLGPSEFDFNWCMYKAFTKRREDGNAATGVKKRSIWSNSTKVIRSACNATGKRETALFSLMEKEAMTFESMRDTLFLMAQPTPENRVRIPVFSHSQKLALGGSSMRTNYNKPIFMNDLPSHVHPTAMFSSSSDAPADNGKLPMHKNFKNPNGMPRLFADSILGNSGYQARLDHLNAQRALPSAATPVAFTTNVPVKESEQYNGFYFSKWIAREHAQLAVEACAYMSRVPGMAGGDYSNGPSTFQNNGGGAPAAALCDERIGRGAPLGVREGLEESDDEPSAEDEERVDANGEVAACIQPAVEPVAAVTDRRRRRDLKRARPGVAVVSTSMSVDENAPVKSLPYDWDVFHSYLTVKMANTLHNDCYEYVDEMRKCEPLVFSSETREETLRNLPQISLRFPGLVHGQVAGEEQLLQPLSVRLSLEQPPGRFHELQKQTVESDNSTDLTKAAVHSIANGCQLTASSPAVLAHEAEARGIDSRATLRGNLFSRSAWKAFTLSVLDNRGLLDNKEHLRVEDELIGLRQRVVVDQSVRNQGNFRDLLGNIAPLPFHSFEAQERKKLVSGRASARKRARPKESDDAADLKYVKPQYVKPGDD